MKKWEEFIFEIYTNIKLFDLYEKYYNKCNVTKTQCIEQDI